jgi:hypothetical protein
MDLVRRDDEEAADADLIEAASGDLGDFFAFSLEGRVRLGEDEASAVRCRVRAELAGRLFENVVVDIGFSDPLGWAPERVRGSDLLAFAGIEPVEVPVISLDPPAAAGKGAMGDGSLVKTARPDGYTIGTLTYDVLTLEVGAGGIESGLLRPVRNRLRPQGASKAPMSRLLPLRSRPLASVKVPLSTLPRPGSHGVVVRSRPALRAGLMAVGTRFASRAGAAKTLPEMVPPA